MATWAWLDSGLRLGSALSKSNECFGLMYHPVTSSTDGKARTLCFKIKMNNPLRNYCFPSPVPGFPLLSMFAAISSMVWNRQQEGR